MKATIIAIGSELLGSVRLDTNSLKLTELLDEFGVALLRKSVVGDDRAAVGRELRDCLALSDVVLISGGLGPTEDDVTKEAVAEALGLELQPDAGVLDHIRELFEVRGMTMPAVNERQARVFRGHKFLPNARGTAPGFHLNVVFEGSPKHVWIFPGVPFELQGMLEQEFRPWLSTLERSSLHRRTIKIAGMSESAVEERLAPFYSRHAGEPFTILASHGEIHIQLRVHGLPDDAYPKLTAMEDEIRQIFGDRVFGLDGDTLESVVGRLLSSRGESVATAESCTGGLLSSRITDVGGSSAYFMGGVITYSRDAKLFLLGVDPASLDEHGEVSEPVARQMANGARRRFGTTYGVGITGIAGPTGGTPSKPVGTVHVAVASHEAVNHRQFLFAGSRELVKHYSTQAALNMLRLMISRGVGG